MVGGGFLAGHGFRRPHLPSLPRTPGENSLFSSLPGGVCALSLPPSPRPLAARPWNSHPRHPGFLGPSPPSPSRLALRPSTSGFSSRRCILDPGRALPLFSLSFLEAVSAFPHPPPRHGADLCTRCRERPSPLSARPRYLTPAPAVPSSPLWAQPAQGAWARFFYCDLRPSAGRGAWTGGRAPGRKHLRLPRGTDARQSPPQHVKAERTLILPHGAAQAQWWPRPRRERRPWTWVPRAEVSSPTQSFCQQ